jgi:hypothetical protein
MAADTTAIMSRLDSIQQDLNLLKARILEDETLTADDRKAIRAAKADYRAGRTKRLA